MKAYATVIINPNYSSICPTQKLSRIAAAFIVIKWYTKNENVSIMQKTDAQHYIWTPMSKQTRCAITIHTNAFTVTHIEVPEHWAEQENMWLMLPPCTRNIRTSHFGMPCIWYYEDIWYDFQEFLQGCTPNKGRSIADNVGVLNWSFLDSR